MLPRVETHGGKNSKIEKSGATTREELYNNIEKNARLNGAYLVLVCCRPIVVAIGLLAVNVVSVNRSAKVTFLVRGIEPRTWLEKQKARQSMTVYIVFWVAAGDPDGGDLSVPSNPSLIPGRLSAQRAHRKPVNAIRSSGSASVRSAGRMPTEKLIHEPPRITFLEPSPGPGGL